MEIIYLKLGDIHPYEKNPRNNDAAVDPVAQSIKEFGFKVPIIIDKDNVIVAGHTRYRAATKLGMTEVPCIKADDLTEEQIKAFRLADNKVSEFAEWDFKLLGEELEGLTMDMEQFGFEMPEEEVEIVEDEVPDLPYNVDYEGGTKEKLKIQNDSWTDDEAFKNFLHDALSNADAVMKPGACFYIWYANMQSHNFLPAIMSVFQIRSYLIWNKNSLCIGRADYQWKHEPCVYGWKEGSHLWASDRKQTTVLDFDRPTKNDIHPTMKPVALFDYEIKNNTKQGDVVLDLFGGSGTTIMACEQNGRVGYTMEYDPRYVDAIVQRWENFTGKKAVLIND